MKLNHYVIDAIHEFISSSINGISSENILQLQRNIGMSISKYTIFSKNICDRFRLDVNVLDKTIYLTVQLQHKYILKFDNIYAAKYFAYKSRSDVYNTSINQFIYSKNIIPNYNEIEIEQDDIKYNIIVNKQTNSAMSTSYNIDVVNTKTRIQEYLVMIYANNKIRVFNRKDFFNNEIYVNDLPENIRNYITTQMTLITLKG
jgi:hypothetical protein